MLKRISTILLSIVYLVLVTGISLNFHYCGGKLKSIAIQSKAEACCCGGDEMESNCCNNKQLLIQFHTDQKLIVSNKISFELSEYIEIERPELKIENLLQSTTQNFLFFDIPPPPKIAIWKSNCSYLFYG